ncbi:hypothetical protein [Flavobacterium sp.]|jgi:hypothetical protein|uniref:hypothetical protein n=1 Tax=Flavobacterium sp. TaxID=239 RepID=UPI0037BE6580
MKKLYTLLALVITLITFAQAPQGFNYQATVRNSAGALIVNQNVLVKFNIYQNTATGTIVYSENQSVTSDDLGHINLVVGQGTPSIGTFSTINWGTGNYYLGIELNTGTGYVAMGNTQLLSVPYALYANSSVTATSVVSASQPVITSVGTLTSATVNGKVTIGELPEASASAILEVNTTTQGFLPPRMTSTQRDLIISPAQGLIIYCTNCGTNGELEVYNGTTWTNISGSAVAATLPILTTAIATAITTTNATCGGNITFDGGAPISARGICWSTAINPTITNTHTSDGIGTGSFLSTISGLIPNTTYYIRAYATNSSGTSYGNQVIITTAIPYFAYVFADTNELAPRNALINYMISQGIPNSNFGSFVVNYPSSNQTTFNAQMNAYLSYSGWGNLSPAIFSAPIPTTSGGLDQYGVYKSAYQFETLQVPPNTIPTGVYCQFVIFVPIAALNGNHYSTILMGNSASGFTMYQCSPLVINGVELTINYTGSTNLPAGDYKVYLNTSQFRFPPGANPVYFHGGTLVPNN